MIKICELCKNEFIVNPKNKRSYNKIFCSGICAKRSNGLKNKGRNHTEEWKKLMSIKNKGENNPFYGRNHVKDSIDKMSKSSKWKEDKFKYCKMSNIEKEIFDGIMISDGSLNKSRISARLTLGFKYMETINRILSDIISIEFLNPWKYESKVDKRTNKSYTGYYTKSKFYHDLLIEYNRWYIDGKKIIPDDILISPIMCYWWFVCDGYNMNGNVFLCTDSFEVKHIENMIYKLKEFGFISTIRKNKRIALDKKSSLVFLDFISRDVQIQKEYLYKWQRKHSSQELPDKQVVI